ncbi:DNA methylase [Lentibacillus halodurans]|uniref:DNA methylase n=1 Tax=Lentibacillus halodurans TaxID=237679 RepID=A0A1I0W4E5_9BACI|nr:DNA methyltransferase [Lentibacillus halodurans]SFA83207.1 DNA methylase [Lentibacillus halodurans]
MTDKNKQLTMINENKDEDEQPVTVLGMTFKNDQERREYFTEELRKKLPELKEIEGFPMGEDEDILALSDPPYYTACPNPWISDFIEQWEDEKSNTVREESYHRETFVADVSEGKSDSVYKAHSYHTKVPHKAIMRYLFHYTRPGEIVYDGFAGTGMTGVAGAMCGDRNSSEDLGYIDNNEIGGRKVVLGDLSPIASYIAYNYNTPIETASFEEEAYNIISEVENEFTWMYETYHNNNEKAKINYTVWSDVFICPNCTSEIVFFEAAVDYKNGKVYKEFCCHSCQAKLKKKGLERSWETKVDINTNKTIEQIKQVPVLINYTYNKKKHNKKPDKFDLNNLMKIDKMNIYYWYPNDRMPLGDESRRNDRTGHTHVHHLYTKRNLMILSMLREKFLNSKHRNALMLLFTSHLINLSKLNRYRPSVSFPYNPLSGTLYMGSQISEANPFIAYKNKVKRFVSAFYMNEVNAVIETSSLTDTNIKDNSIDYIFTDPPFGANIMYSELSFMWESWIKVITNNQNEAVINKTHNRLLPDYQELMQDCFEQYYRVLKPGRWITVEFSNSKASVWNAIQESLQRAGFVIANVSALDKKMGSFKAVTTTIAVKQDLVISAYKPSKKMIQEIESNDRSSETAWAFIKQHLENLPVFMGDKGEAHQIVERTPRVLFDRMVAYHVQNGLVVPISSGDFQAEVTQRFPIRDGMVFLENQVAEYDKKRILVKDFTQTTLFVSDENSAIEWIRQQLMKKPQTRQDLHPNFMKEIQHIHKHELLPELDQLLEQNFLEYVGDGPVPDQIASYLKKNYKSVRGLENDHSDMKNLGMNRWYVPNPNKQADLEKLRERSLLREFESYVEEVSKSRKKLKQFRTEAIRAGFKKAWSDKEYQKIVDVGERLPEKVIQEDDKLLMYFDNAQIRLGM